MPASPRTVLIAYLGEVGSQCSIHRQEFISIRWLRTIHIRILFRLEGKGVCELVPLVPIHPILVNFGFLLMQKINERERERMKHKERRVKNRVKRNKRERERKEKERKEVHTLISGGMVPSYFSFVCNTKCIWNTHPIVMLCWLVSFLISPTH
jgi:hypothetical protein